MIQTKKTLSSDEFIKRAVNVALYYGFMPPRRIATDAARNMPGGKRPNRRPLEPRSAFDQHTAEFHTALQTYIDHNFHVLPQPVQFYHSNIEHSISRSSSKSTKDTILLNLQIIGTRKSIAEAMIIKATFDVLEEIGSSGAQLYINTIGDRESVVRYSKELAAYFRKNIDDLPASARLLLKKDPLLTFAQLTQKQHPLADAAPRSIEFLSEQSRNHLREVLEYLETVHIAYEIDSTLVGLGDCHSQTIFEIRGKHEGDDALEEEVYASGGRYDEFSRRIFKLNIPAVGVVIVWKHKGKSPIAFLHPSRIRQPKIYFIQFGFEAKLRSLIVLEMLRKAKIPFQQSLGSDKLTGQLQWAERLNIPYTIIMGQKEALEGAVIVRNMSSRSQDTIPLVTLPIYLKKLV